MGEVFVRKNPKNSNEKVAILLMDTQGMFDGEISQQLTTHIFGVSTLPEFVSDLQRVQTDSGR